MPGSDDHDTVVDRHDRWSPGGPPPAEGWYDDPWNAEFLRRWDGAQWTGETIRKGEIPPPAGEPEPAPAYESASGHESAPVYSAPAYESGYEEVWTPTDEPDPGHGPGAPADDT